MLFFKSIFSNGKSIPVNAAVIEESVEGDHYKILSDGDAGWQSIVTVEVYRDGGMVKRFVITDIEEDKSNLGAGDIECDVVYITNSLGRTVDKIKCDGSDL